MAKAIAPNGILHAVDIDQKMGNVTARSCTGKRTIRSASAETYAIPSGWALFHL